MAGEAQQLADAWRAYASALAGVPEPVVGGPFFEDGTAARAYAYLAGIVERSHDAELRAGDLAYPRFFRGGSAPGRDARNSNPDTFYLYALVDGSKHYRVEVEPGTVSQTILGSHEPRSPGQTSLDGAVDRITGEQLVPGPDGVVEIAVGPTRPDGAAIWLRTTPDVRELRLYEVYGDWARERRGVWTIHAVSSLGVARPEPSSDEVATRLGRITSAARDLAAYWQKVTEAQLARTVPNTFTAPVEQQVAMLGAKFSRCQWQLYDDEALIVEARPPADARYWGWATATLFGTLLDYANRHTSLNHTQGVVDPDGVLRVVLAARDPGVRNWLDVSAHPKGIVTWRVSTPHTPPTPEARVVTIDEVRSVLPPATAAVRPEERAAEIARRQRQIARRYAE